MESVISEFEGTLLHEANTFSYFMLVAFEASGLIRFTFLLMLWPLICLLNLFRMETYGLKIMIFVATVGLRVSDIESVARAVLPKFFMDDIDMKAWGVFSRYDNRVVVTNIPRVMVSRFVKEHLMADHVVGCELAVTWFGRATGFVKEHSSAIKDRVQILFLNDKPNMGLGRLETGSHFLSLCKEQLHPPFTYGTTANRQPEIQRPLPVIFHDGRLVKRPTPSTALLIVLWIPFGIVLVIIRITLGVILPMWAIPYATRVFGGNVIVKGNPPPPSNSGVLYVCTHRTLMDPVILSVVLQRSVPAVTYSVSRLSEILSPIPTIRLTRNRHMDAEKITRELSKGDLAVCPEGTTCREPFLLRFSGLFAELTDRIVPVAMNYRVGFFHATTARGWKCLDPIFFFMNPRPIYEVTFLSQLPHEATCSSGKSPNDVANYVQKLLGATLGFECTSYTRKDKYRILAGNEGNVAYGTNTDRFRKWVKGLREVMNAFKLFIHWKQIFNKMTTLCFAFFVLFPMFSVFMILGLSVSIFIPLVC